MSKTKLKVRLTDQNGNVFNLIGIVSRELKKNGHAEEVKPFQDKCYQAKSYDEVLRIISDLVEIE
jgi:hypothetical protein